VVVVTGSVGKTSTTQAIATVLEKQFRVGRTIKNYNSDLGVPCSITSCNIPDNLKNPLAWLAVITKGFLKLLLKQKIDIYVLELGTDRPGEIAQFYWLKPDIAVITAIAPEHMEYFKTIEAVAVEELSVSDYSQLVMINKNMVPNEYLNLINNDEIYNYSREDIVNVGLKAKDLNVIGDHSLDAVSAGLGVAKQLGMAIEEIKEGALEIEAQNGRMNQLAGLKNSVLIDDTYNSSPEATLAALDYIYSLPKSQKIVLLGNMNELGETSEIEHTKIGEYCNPDKLDLVITLGVDANKYTAESARKKGCKVAQARDPYEAGELIKEQLEQGAVVLFKGSQNGVFAEEAVKMLLADPDDSKYLVRQSKFWMKIKKESFSL
jgi:UDP-N-acetylmuramoyl-tripeptide--D-alanyl-D-alanine ligase